MFEVGKTYDDDGCGYKMTVTAINGKVATSEARYNDESDIWYYFLHNAETGAALGFWNAKDLTLGVVTYKDSNAAAGLNLVLPPPPKPKAYFKAVYGNGTVDDDFTAYNFFCKNDLEYNDTIGMFVKTGDDVTHYTADEFRETDYYKDAKN